MDERKNIQANQEIVTFSEKYKCFQGHQGQKRPMGQIARFCGKKKSLEVASAM